MGLKDPKRWLWLGLTIVGGLWAANLGFSGRNPEWTAISASLSTPLSVLTGIFVTAIISIYVYDYVNRQNQLRGWRHDYALSVVKEIYGPLFDETNRLIRLVKALEDIPGNVQRSYLPADRPMGYAAFSEIHLALFVDAKAKALLEDFHDSLDKYVAVKRSAWEELLKVADDDSMGFARQAGNPEVGKGLSSAFISYRNFIFDPAGYPAHESLARAYYRENFVGRGLGDEKAAEAAFNATLNHIRGQPSVKEFKAARDECVARGLAALDRLRAIMRDPTTVQLESL